MALISCYECKREISSSASSCPHCGAPRLRDGALIETQAESGGPRMEGVKKHALPLWVQVAAGLVGAYVVFSCTSGSSGASSTAKPGVALGQADALLMCQSAIKRAARDPDRADVPYVPSHGSGDEYYFAWGGSTKMARMRNGLGLDVAVSASCTVSKSQKRITSLTLDGRSLLASSAAHGGVGDVRVGMSRGEVVMLLGEPGHTDYPGGGAAILTWSSGAMVSMEDGRVVRVFK